MANKANNTKTMGGAKGANDDIEKQDQHVVNEKEDKCYRWFKLATIFSVCTFVVVAAVSIPTTISLRNKHANSLNPIQTSKFEEDPNFNFTAQSDNTNNSPSNSPSNSLTTLQPSVSSSEPTMIPTFIHSETPSISPSRSFMPGDAFKIRLFWQQGYYWQENWDERWFCMECTKCDEYGNLDGYLHGCEKYKPDDSNSVNQCEINDQFWIMPCKERSTYFNVLDTGAGLQVRINGTSLCMERGATQNGEYGKRYLRVRECDETRSKQLFAPIASIDKFELRSYNQIGWTEDKAECVSQLHHPKDTELLSFQSCKLDRIYETRYWEKYDG